MAGTYEEVRHDPDYRSPPTRRPEHRITLTVEEAAALLGVGRTAAYEAARRGEIPCRKLGRRVIVPVPALLDWLGVTPTP